jgi:type IV pilus biogenesis protein PilP
MRADRKGQFVAVALVAAATTFSPMAAPLGAMPVVTAASQASSAQVSEVPLGLTLAAMQDKAPTIATLADLQRRELEADVARRLTKMSAIEAKPAASAPALPAVQIIKTKNMAPSADTAPIKRVLAIYGPEGDERADLALGDGSITAVHAGSTFGSFTVVSISRTSVKIEIARVVKAEVKPDAKKVSHDVRSRQRDEAHRPSKGVPAQVASTQVVHSTLDVPVGAAFR